MALMALRVNNEEGKHESAYDELHRRNHTRGIISVFDEAVPHADAVERKVSADRVVGQRMAQARVGTTPIDVTPGAVGGCSD